MKVLQVRLEVRDYEVVRRMARKLGLSMSQLVRMWVKEKMA